MQIFEKYIAKHALVPLLKVKQHKLPTHLVIVIPCYDEPDIKRTLDSLLRCEAPGCRTEVIIVVNSGESAPEEVIQQNRQTYFELLAFKEKYSNSDIGFSPILVQNIRAKHAGVGMARKIGMDQAVLLFSGDCTTDGIIVSLDADTLVEKNYLKVIHQRFVSQGLDLACIDFLHPLQGDEYDEEVYQGILMYELHLRYVRLATEMARFPYVMHTLGSAFAVRAETYVAHGGMNRKQGGEDFYFLHKVRPHVRYEEILDTTVHPSPRSSYRVPFGTGPKIGEWCETKQLLTYDLHAFFDLKSFLSRVEELYQMNQQAYGDFLETMPDSIRSFLEEEHFDDLLLEINANSASKEAFVKRFYQNFTAFKVVKFLNQSHVRFYEKSDVMEMCYTLFKYLGLKEMDHDAHRYLEQLRKIEKTLSF